MGFHKFYDELRFMKTRLNISSFSANLAERTFVPTFYNAEFEFSRDL